MGQLNDLASLNLRVLSAALASPRLELGHGEWLGVVELLTMRLVEGCHGLQAEEWTTCSAALQHTFEAAVDSGSIDRSESVIRQLNLSVALLQQISPNRDVDILNPDYLFGLLFRELPMSAEDARCLSIGWRTLDISQIRLLRAAKNLLSPALNLAGLVPIGDFTEDLSAWKEVFPSLP